MAAIVDQRLGGIELVPLVGPVTHQPDSLGHQLIVQQAEGILIPLAVPQLIAHAEQGDDTSFQRHILDVFPAGFPIFLQLAEVPGGDAEDQDVVLLHAGQGHVLDVVEINQLGANEGADLLGGHLGVAGGGAVKQTYLHRSSLDRSRQGGVGQPWGPAARVRAPV
ncbi:hypothetical protein D3C85_1021750 [compost metagenome]